MNLLQISNSQPHLHGIVIQLYSCSIKRHTTSQCIRKRKASCFFVYFFLFFYFWLDLLVHGLQKKVSANVFRQQSKANANLYYYNYHYYYYKKKKEKKKFNMLRPYKRISWIPVSEMPLSEPLPVHLNIHDAPDPGQVTQPTSSSTTDRPWLLRCSCRKLHGDI